MASTEIAIIGAGLAGLACGRALQAAGHMPVLLDKSRGVGGRLATRRAEGGLSFDHGAQFVTARTRGFNDVLESARQAGCAAPWDTGDPEVQIVGTPGMNGIAKHMAAGLDIKLGIAARAVTPVADGWRIDIDDGYWTCKKVVLTLPAAQAGVLLGDRNPLAQALSAAEMAPCFALMACFEDEVSARFTARRDPEDVLDWIALNRSKPGRAGPPCWVAHASPGWSKEHLERSLEEITALMLPLLCNRLGVDPASASHVAAHRWRYARVTSALGAPFASDAAGTLFAGGDWCLGARAECAWESGIAIARKITDTA